MDPYAGQPVVADRFMKVLGEYAKK
jgi:hypothetical protein